MAIRMNDLPPDVQKQIKSQMSERKRSKYGNKPTSRFTADNIEIKFSSQKEARRYDELMLLLKAGQISDLRLQHSYQLQGSYTLPTGEKVKGISYVADFTYQKLHNGKYEFVCEDVKGGILTDSYKLKKRMMADKFGIKIVEI